MNITSILSIIDYDMSKIDIYSHTGEDGILNFRFKEVSCHGSFNKYTSEVTYVWCRDSTGVNVYLTSVDNYHKRLQNSICTEEEILDLLCETFYKEPYVNVPLEIDTTELAMIDSLAASEDLTRNSYLVKCVLNSLKMLDEKFYT